MVQHVPRRAKPAQWTKVSRNVKAKRAPKRRAKDTYNAKQPCQHYVPGEGLSKKDHEEGRGVGNRDPGHPRNAILKRSTEGPLGGKTR